MPSSLASTGVGGAPSTDVSDTQFILMGAQGPVYINENGTRSEVLPGPVYLTETS